MAIELFGRTIDQIGVVGSGQIGPDIALYFSKIFHRHNVPVIVFDVAEKALEAGRAKVEKKIARGVESRSFKPEQAKRMLENIKFTSDKNELHGSDLVIEAATERTGIKRAIVKDLEAICGEGAILASNSSHMEPEVIFAEAERPAQGLVIHYFFPAERNPLVEIVPGEKTDPAVTDWCMRLYEWMGKVPVRVKSRYGYAIDPVFEGLLQAAVLCVEEGLGTTKEVDTVARKALGLGVGPFTAMNLTGGNPITQHGLNELHEKVIQWYRSPNLLDTQLASGKRWDTPRRGEKVEVGEEAREKISKRMIGAYLGLAGEILDSGIIDPADFEMALELGLVIRPPLALANELGVDVALGLVKAYAAENEGFPIPEVLQKQGTTPFRIDYVRRHDVDDVAVLTIKRPRVLNALNLEVVSQIGEQIDSIAADGKIKAAVITGFGAKAFVSGADIDMLAAVKSPEEGVENSKKFQRVFRRIETFKKPVVAALNGLALGGGSELALACHARVARSGLRVALGQPEPKLGIIPGAGGTQRLTRLIGFEEAMPILRTAGALSSEEAAELGLIRELTDGDVVDTGVRLARDAANGEVELKRIDEGPLSPPNPIPFTDIGGLSKAVDKILVRAILEGAQKTLEDGLAFESEMFGEICKTKDMKIGMENFVKTGLKKAAEFVHA